MCVISRPVTKVHTEDRQLSVLSLRDSTNAFADWSPMRFWYSYLASQSVMISVEFYTSTVNEEQWLHTVLTQSRNHPWHCSVKLLGKCRTECWHSRRNLKSVHAVNSFFTDSVQMILPGLKTGLVPRLWPLEMKVPSPGFCHLLDDSYTPPSQVSCKCLINQEWP